MMSFYPANKSARRLGSSVRFWFWATGSRPGAGRLRRVWRSSGFAGDSSILNTTAGSVRARWKKGHWAAVGKLLSQLSFSVYAGQVVFRGALRQDGDRELGDRETFLTSLFSPVLFCFLFLLGSFCLRTRAECAAERSRQQLPAFPFFVFRFPRLRARSARPGALATMGHAEPRGTIVRSDFGFR